MPCHLISSVIAPNRRIVLFLWKVLSFSFAIHCIAHAQAASNGGWKFEWSDEFNGPSIDASVWGYETGYVRNNEAQYYTNRTENSRIDNGTLLIQALRDNWNGHEYTSASRRTMSKKSWLYGRFEMRAKIDIRQGSWPAWWWLPNSGGWPAGGEIDMMEYYGGNCLFNVMDGRQRWTSKTKSTSSLGGGEWAARFHVWTWVWDSLKIDISLDGTLMNHYLVANADGTGPGGANPFRRPGYMLVNQAIGGTNGGDPSKTSFPVEYRIDWIRVHSWNIGAAYWLTVNDGIGSGPYVEGTLASITAMTPHSGEIFDKWVVHSGNPAIDCPDNPSARLTMPAADVEVAASFKKESAVFHPVVASMHSVASTGPSVVYDVWGRKRIQYGGNHLGRSRLPAGVYLMPQRDRSVVMLLIGP